MRDTVLFQSRGPRPKALRECSSISERFGRHWSPGCRLAAALGWPTGPSKKPQVWRKPCQRPVRYKKSLIMPRSKSTLRASRRSSLLAHPDVPRDRPGFLIGHWAARYLEGQLDLTVMVALVPDHVLEQEDRVVIVKVQVAACLHSTLYRVAHHLGAVVQHLRDATRVTLGHPLFFGQLSGELGGVLKDE